MRWWPRGREGPARRAPANLTGAKAAALLLLSTALVLAGCGSSSPVVGKAPSPEETSTPGTAGASGAAAGAPSWIKDSLTTLDVFAPDGSAVYYLNAYDTAGGGRTILQGAVPRARYWSYTLYPGKAHRHDTQILQSDGRYRLTLAASCAGVTGSCIATTGARVGVVVLRLYVPVDYSTSGTGGVPLPSVSYVTAGGGRAELSAAPGAARLEAELAPYRSRDGALPAALTHSYPAAGPVATAVNPAPAESRGGQGQFSNPDNAYVKIPYDTSRGDLVLSAEAPTFQADSFPSDNDLGRPAAARPQSRYWSLCTDLEGDYTSACLRDEQVKLEAGTSRFVVVVAPQCPVAGYANCLVAGPAPLERAVLYRVLLPSPAFSALAFTGAYTLTARYVPTPG